MADKRHSHADTEALVDQVLRITGGDHRGAIAYLLGQLEGAESEINRIRFAVGTGYPRKRFTDILREDLAEEVSE